MSAIGTDNQLSFLAVANTYERIARLPISTSGGQPRRRDANESAYWRGRASTARRSAGQALYRGAREGFLAAAETFDALADSLAEKRLREMQ